MPRNRNLSYSINNQNSGGIFRATVMDVGTDTISVRIPRLSQANVYSNVPFYGNKPSVDDEIIVGFLEGDFSTPVAIIPSSSVSSGVVPQGDIEGVTAGLGLSGGGTTGTISLAFAPSELSSVTVATDDKVVIADTSDSDNPKHVTVSSIAALATASPAGSDTQVQFNNSGSFGASSNMVFDGTNLDIAGLKIGGTAVTSTAAELNILDGVTATATEINYLDDDDLTAADLTKLAAVTSTAAELNLVDGITAGTVSASKAVIADSNSGFSSAGQFTAYSGGADGGIVLGRAFGGYVGLRTAGMAEDSGDEYVIMSDGQHTFISAGGGTDNTEGDVYIRAGGNSTTCQIQLDTSANDINVTGDIVSSDDITCDILNVTNEIRVGDGSSGDPGYTFTSDSSVGMFYGGTNTLSFSAAAVELTMTATALYPAFNEGLELGQSGHAWNHFWLGQANQFSSGGYYTLRSRDSDRQVMELVSSERFKKDIVDLPLSEAYKVLDARVIKYRGADDDSSVPLEVGLSAESLHNAGYEYAVRYDEGHWGTTPRSIYYEYLTAPLIAIIKDLKERIEALES